jgi:hypothetical protein
MNIRKKGRAIKVKDVTWRQLRGLNNLEFRVRNSLLGYKKFIYI